MRKFVPLFSFAMVSLIAGPIPVANANELQCMQQYESDMAKCDGNGSCLQHANIKFNNCMWELAFKDM